MHPGLAMSNLGYRSEDATTDCLSNHRPSTSLMSELKTKQNDGDVESFLNGVEDEAKRRDCHTIMEIMRKIAKGPPKMWGTSVVGFGNYHYTYASGREGDWFLTGFSPRKQSITLYIMSGFDRYEELMTKLGKYKTGKSCLYIKSLDDVHLPTLKTLIRESVTYLSKIHS